MARKRRDRHEQPAPESRKQQHLSRRDREQRKLILSIAVPLLALTVGVLVFGAWRELYQVPNTPVAEVAGERIPASNFTQRIDYERRLMLNYINSILPLIQSSDPSFINQLVSGQRTNIAQTTQDKLIDEAIIRQESAKRGITVEGADVDQQIYGEMATALAPPATAAPEVTPTPLVTGTLAISATVRAPATATTAPTAEVTPISTQEAGRQFEQRVQPMLDQLQMTRAQYREVVRQQVFRDRLTKVLADEIPAAEQQAELDYLVFKDKATADQAAAELGKGTTWADIVARFGPRPTPAEGEASPTAAAEEGGGSLAVGTGTPTAGPTPSPTPEPYALEAGTPTWYTKYKLTTDWAVKPEEADAVLAVAKGALAPVLSGTKGFYLAFVRDAAANRPTDETELKTRRENALTDWLTEKKNELTAADLIKRFPLEAFVPPEPAWFSQGFDQLLATPVATVPGGGLQISTMPPPAAATAAPAGGTPAP